MVFSLCLFYLGFTEVPEFINVYYLQNLRILKLLVLQIFFSAIFSPLLVLNYSYVRSFVIFPQIPVHLVSFFFFSLLFRLDTFYWVKRDMALLSLINSKIPDPPLNPSDITLIRRGRGALFPLGGCRSSDSHIVTIIIDVPSYLRFPGSSYMSFSYNIQSF